MVPIVLQLTARKKLYMGTDQNTTVDIIRAIGTEALVEAEDPKLRNMYPLQEFLQVWKTQAPFSGEPFFQWLDFGSGRFASSESNTRAEIEEEYCHVMDDEARAKAVVIPRIETVESDGEIGQGGNEKVQVILRYEFADLPVESGYLLFVWGLDDKLYVHPDQSTLFHHICFFHARPVRAAGEIYVGEHGALQEIWNDSGHYRPSDWSFRLLYRHLKAMFPQMTATTIKWVNEHTELELRDWLRFHFEEET